MAEFISAVIAESGLNEFASIHITGNRKNSDITSITATRIPLKIFCFFVLLNLLPSKEGNFLWNTYFKYLRCSYEENEWDKKTVTKTAFYNHRNDYVSHFLALLSKPYAELVEDLTPEQKKWFPDYLLPNNFVNENDDPCVLSSYGQIIQSGPRKTDLSKEDSEKLNQRLLARKII